MSLLQEQVRHIFLPENPLFSMIVSFLKRFSVNSEFLTIRIIGRSAVRRCEDCGGPSIVNERICRNPAMPRFRLMHSGPIIQHDHVSESSVVGESQSLAAKKIELLEESLREALSQYESITRSEDDSSLDRQEVVMKVRDAYCDLEYWDKALEFEEIWSESFCETDVDRAAGLCRQGKLLMRLQETSKANMLYRQALDLYKHAFGEGYHCPEIGNILISMAGVQYHRHHYQESLDLLLQSEAHFADPNDAVPYHPDMVKCYQHQGLVYRTMEHYEEALSIYQVALELLEQLTRSTKIPNNEAFSKRQGLQLDIADMMSALARADEALQLYNTILRNDEEWSTRESVMPDLALHGILFHNIGKLHAQFGDLDSALDYLNRAIMTKTTVLGETHPELSKSWNALGAVRATLLHFHEAQECFQRSLFICRMHYGENDPQILHVLRNLSLLSRRKDEERNQDG